MWIQIAAFWQFVPSLGSFVIAVLAVTAIPFTLTCRTWLKGREGHQRALNEKYRAETERQVRRYQAESDRQLSLRELDIEQEKMRLEARHRRESLIALAQEEMRFPPPIEAEQGAIDYEGKKAA